MKNYLGLFLFCFYAVVLCGQTKSSFKEVTKHLQKDGEFYLYLSTEDAIDAFNKRIDEFHNKLTSSDDIKDDLKKNIENGFQLFNTFIDESGVKGISGFGASAKKNNAGIFENKFFLHHYPTKNNGMLWKAFGNKPHNLDELSLLPADTVLAIYQDFDFASNFKWTTNLIMNSDIPLVADKTKRLISAFKTFGFDMDKVLSSLNGGGGIAITMDKLEKIEVALGSEKNLKINKPAIILFFKIKNDFIFNSIKSKLIFSKDSNKNLAEYVESENKKILKIKIGIPFINSNPVVIQTKKYLMIASSQKIVDNAFEVQSGKKKGLLDTEEFKLLSKGIPLNGNGFSFISSRMQTVIEDIQNSAVDGGMQKILQQAFYNSEQKYTTFNVVSVFEDGILGYGKSYNNLATSLSSAFFVFPIGVMGATLLPSLSMARESARKISCINNLKQIGLACRMYSAQHDDKFPELDGVAGLKELKDLLGRSQVYVCPSSSTIVQNNQPLTEDTVSYVYLGGFSEYDNCFIPLAFDKPGNHNGFCNVLFLDGHVKEFAGKNFKTCKEIIEFLIKQNDYSEKIKTILRLKAEDADKRLLSK